MNNNLWMPSLFNDHMVLQRERKNPVWGTAAPEIPVIVSMGEQEQFTRSDRDGRWRLELDPMPAGGPHTLTVTAGETRIFEDVLVGEVWFCSGQSNMGMPVQRCAEAGLETVTAHYEEIRFLRVPQVPSQEPMVDFEGEWKRCTPQTIPDFSALAYFFGRRLYHAIGVPIGLIHNAWGGSSAEAWLPRDLLEADERYHPVLKDWDDQVAAHDEVAFAEEMEAWEKEKAEWEAGGAREGAPGQPSNPILQQRRPANLYNGVLYPTIGYGIRGFIWYQGESNTHPVRDYDYRYLFPLLIRKFREEWGQGDFPFYWVQLPNWRDQPSEPEDHSWSWLRESQDLTLDQVSNGGQAVAIDVGEGRDLHPKHKQPIADRLARIALARDYGFDLVYQSPRFDQMTIEGNTATLYFKHVTDQGLYAFETREVRGFAIAGGDRIFHWANAEIIGKNYDQLKVWSDDVPHPVAVRYAWSCNPDCNLYDMEGLPVIPFRTDDWPQQIVEDV